MRYTEFSNILLLRGQSKKHIRAFTYVELLIVMAIAATLVGIAVPVYNNHIDKARNTTAMADIRTIEGRLVTFQAERGRPANTLAEAGLPAQIDPWGNPYEYLRIGGVDPKDIEEKTRKDHMTHPLNTDFDLYSMGKDGDSQPPLTAGPSHDDIVRANNGAFVGMGSDY